jgi:hypothetical protein
MPILIQITVAKEHAIVIHGVSAILKTIPGNWKREARLLFVVSERSKLDRPQSFNGSGDKTAWENTLKQRVVCLTDEELCAEH